MKIIQIYTDGACSGNPGPGGYGVIMKFNGREKIITEGFRKTTNNRMELLSIIVALEKVTVDAYPIEIYSDSKYVIDSITKGPKLRSRIDPLMALGEFCMRWMIKVHFLHH